MSVEPGQTLLHYRIVDKLGEGGMGAVYRAEDTRLGREVAIKVMPAALARDPERRRRFEQEARAVAALKHPNIVTIHSVEEADTSAGPVQFITMELIEGRPLSELIPESGLDLARLFELAIPAADALSSAHTKGITHRDLKPANMMLDADSRLKVLDFGLAKLLAHEDAAAETATQILTSAPRTEEGKILGTAAYMSPEQAEGKPVDARTDIFSLGVVLFEMATGRRPFQGDTAISTISSILKDVPPRVSEVRTSLPRHLGRVIDRCLEKNPAKRFQTARDVANELENLKQEIDSGQLETGEPAIPPQTTSGVAPAPARASSKAPWLAPAVVVVAAVIGSAWWTLRDREGSAPPVVGTGAAAREAPSRPMIAVLPFDNLGPAEDAYFAAGITDEIIGRLSGVGALGVISRTSVTQYDRTGKTLRQVGDDLGVSYVLEGTVRWARSADGAGQVRITPQLVRVADDSQLWAGTYDRQIADIFEVQSSIAGEVIDQLGVTLASGERTAFDQRPTDNLEAYQAYLRGREELGTRTLAEWMKYRDENLEHAVKLDPEFLEAWSWLSRWHSLAYFSYWDRSESRLDAAKQAMGRAIAIAPDHPETLLARGYYHYFGFRDYDRALVDFEAALASVPNDTEAREAVAYIHRRQGRIDEALAGLEAVLPLAPRDTNLLRNIADIYRGKRDFDRSIELRRRIGELNPDDGWNRLALTSHVLDKTEDVSRALEQWRELPPNPESQAYFVGSAFLAFGNRDFAGAYEWARQIPGDSPQDRRMRRELMLGFEALRDGPESARASLEAWVEELKARIESEPGNAELRQKLAGAYAQLGEAEAAVREGRMAVDLTARDRWSGPKAEQSLAGVYAELGRTDDALDLIQKLLEMTYEDSITLVNLRLMPAWDKLRQDERFRALVAEGGR